MPIQVRISSASALSLSKGSFASDAPRTPSRQSCRPRPARVSSHPLPDAHDESSFCFKDRCECHDLTEAHTVPVALEVLVLDISHDATSIHDEVGTKRDPTLR